MVRFTAKRVCLSELPAINKQRNKLRIIKTPRHEVLHGFLDFRLKNASGGGAAESKILRQMLRRLIRFALR